MAVATVTLTDDDKTTTPPGDKDTAEISITGPASNVAEGSDASFTVTLSKAVAAEVAIAWSAPLATDSASSSDLSVHFWDGYVRRELGCGGDPDDHCRRRR